jgi:hypothetical protein
VCQPPPPTQTPAAKYRWAGKTATNAQVTATSAVSYFTTGRTSILRQKPTSLSDCFFGKWMFCYSYAKAAQQASHIALPNSKAESIKRLDRLQRLNGKPTPAVIIVTDDPYPLYRHKCLEAGADFF